MNASSLDIAIAALHSQNAKDQARIESQRVTVTVVRNGVTPAAAKKAEKAKREAPTQQKSAGSAIVVKGLFLQEKGSLGPVEFLRSMKDAGRRPFKAELPDGSHRMVIKIDPSKVRDDQVIAIAAFNGWDPSRNFGEQEVAARMKANRDIEILKGAEKQSGDSIVAIRRAANRSLSGFVNGCPDMVQRTIAHLVGQEREAVEEMVEHNRNQTRNQEWIVKLTIIEAKLDAIRTEMARLTV